LSIFFVTAISPAGLIGDRYRAVTIPLELDATDNADHSM
jgi:hypothetical protein